MIINMDSIVHLLSEQMWLTLVLSLPLVGGTAAAGIIISLIQAITQVQDQTIQFFLKLVVFGGIVAITGNWMLQSIITYTQQVMMQI